MDADSQPKLTPDRLEAFSDGVIAVIITIMVLELKVPRAGGVAGLREILPILLVYALSFAFTGIYWVNHHLLVDRVKEIDSRVLYTNLLFLFSLSLLPFFTSWVIEKGRDTFSVLVYCVSLMVTGSTFLMLRLSIERRRRMAGQHAVFESAERRKNWISLGLYAAAIPCCFVQPTVALVLAGAVNVVWVLPGLGVAHRTERAAERVCAVKALPWRGHEIVDRPVCCREEPSKCALPITASLS